MDSPARELALLMCTGGFRPGLWANLMGKLPSGLLYIDYVDLTIASNEPRVKGSVKVGIAGSSTQQLSIEGTLIKKSDVRLTETIFKALALGQSVDLPGPLKLSRDLIVTFLDKDLLIARDESGVPDIWLRKLSLALKDSPLASPEVLVEAALNASATVERDVLKKVEEKTETEVEEEADDKEGSEVEETAQVEAPMLTKVGEKVGMEVKLEEVVEEEEGVEDEESAEDEDEVPAVDEKETKDKKVKKKTGGK